MFKASLKCGTHTFNKTSQLNDCMRFLIIILSDCLLKVLVTIFALQVFLLLSYILLPSGCTTYD